MPRHLLVAGALAAALGLCGPAGAQGFQRTPLPPDHPLLGLWRIDIPGTGCHELYRLSPDGTSRVTSGEEVSESELSVSLRPSERGYYRWADRVTRTNGKPDCSGEATPLGDVSVKFILLHRSGDQFLMCDEERFDTCIGPFVRQDEV